MKALHLLLFLFLLSCSSSRMVQTDLYFGQSKPDGSIISNTEWKNFTATYFNKYFKEGSTTIAATGTWFDPDKKELIAEPTFVVSYIHKHGSLISSQIDSLRAIYKSTFLQQSVLRVDRKVKVSF